MNSSHSLSAPSPLCWLPAIAHQQPIRPLSADLSGRSAGDATQVFFEIFEPHRWELLPFGRLRHGRISSSAKSFCDSKWSSIKLSSLRLLTLRFATSNQSQMLSLSNS